MAKDTNTNKKIPYRKPTAEEEQEFTRYKSYRVKISTILDVALLTGIIVLLTVCSIGITFGIIFPSALYVFKSRIEGNVDRTFNLLLDFTLKNLTKSILMWLMLFPVLIFLGVSLFFCIALGGDFIAFAVVEGLAIIALITFSFFLFYELVCDTKAGKIELFKRAYRKMKTNLFATFVIAAMIVGVVVAAILIPIPLIKYIVMYALLMGVMYTGTMSLTY